MVGQAGHNTRRQKMFLSHQTFLKVSEKIVFKCDFMQLFNDFIHVQSPGAGTGAGTGADNSRRNTSLVAVES